MGIKWITQWVSGRFEAESSLELFVARICWVSFFALLRHPSKFYWWPIDCAKNGLPSSSSRRSCQFGSHHIIYCVCGSYSPSYILVWFMILPEEVSVPWIILKSLWAHTKHLKAVLHTVPLGLRTCFFQCNIFTAHVTTVTQKEVDRIGSSERNSVQCCYFFTSLQHHCEEIGRLVDGVSYFPINDFFSFDSFIDTVTHTHIESKKVAKFGWPRNSCFTRGSSIKRTKKWIHVTLIVDVEAKSKTKIR